MRLRCICLSSLLAGGQRIVLTNIELYVIMYLCWVSVLVQLLSYFDRRS